MLGSRRLLSSAQRLNMWFAGIWIEPSAWKLVPLWSVVLERL